MYRRGVKIAFVNLIRGICNALKAERPRSNSSPLSTSLSSKAQTCRRSARICLDIKSIGRVETLNLLLKQRGIITLDRCLKIVIASCRLLLEDLASLKLR
jgi:hypothetical protein